MALILSFIMLEIFEMNKWLSHERLGTRRFALHTDMVTPVTPTQLALGVGTKNQAYAPVCQFMGIAGMRCYLGVDLIAHRPVPITITCQTFERTRLA